MARTPKPGRSGNETLAVFGATGRTGRLVVEEALVRGDRVRALARDPATAPAEWLNADAVHIVAGDALDAAAVRRTIEGASAVVVVLGHAKDSPANVLERSMRNILAAMDKTGVRRIVYLTGAGVGQSADRPGIVDRVFQALVRVVARDLYRDSVASTALLRASGLDWTVCRATRLVDGAAGAELHVGPLGPSAKPRVSRADIARWIVAEVHDRRHVHDTPVVTNRR